MANQDIASLVRRLSLWQRLVQRLPGQPAPILPLVAGRPCPACGREVTPETRGSHACFYLD